MIQEVLPDASPTDRPVRDVSATNMSISINHLQRYTNQENGGSKGVINDEEILMEANLLYTRHFKAIGRLFGKEDMDFTEQR